jgi:hypothetical protein
MNALAKRLVLGLAMLGLAHAPGIAAQTTFTFGGYVKMDAMTSQFHNGPVPLGSPLRDFHFPAAIPVGRESDVFATNDYLAKESRFNLETWTLMGEHTIRAFVEMDFLLAGQGDERVSNSFNPRLRHFFFTYRGWLFGQTWTTFQILDIPDDLDFAGAADGIIFNRQPQIRFTTGRWQFAAENTSTSLTPFGGGTRIDSPAAFFPDLIARYNFGGDWGNLSLAGMMRQMTHEYEDGDVTRNSKEPAFGATFGGKIGVGSRDDLRFQGSVGSGLGRYAALQFANGGVIRDDETLDPLPSYLGFLGYRHFWSDHLRSNLNVSGIRVENDPNLTGPDANRAAWSVSINLIYSPVPQLHFGAELMRGNREVENGASGSFDRLQLSARYDFRFSTGSTEDEGSIRPAR